jgi:hypothetical protein
MNSRLRYEMVISVESGSSLYSEYIIRDTVTNDIMARFSEALSDKAYDYLNHLNFYETKKEINNENL